MAEMQEEEDDYHYESRLCGLWGREALNTLRYLVKSGEIEAPEVWSLAQHRRVRARIIYNENKHLPLTETFERILEFWLNQELFRLQPESARALLVEVLTDSRCTPKVIAIIEQKMGLQTGDQPAGKKPDKFWKKDIENKLAQEKTERRATDKKFRSKLDEVTLRLEEVEIQMKNDRQNSEREKSALKQEKEELQEKLSTLEEKLKEESEGKQSIEKRIQSLESKSESFASQLSSNEDRSARSDIKTAGGGREPLIVLASDGIAAEYAGEKLGQYSLSGDLNNSPYYVQTKTLSDSDSPPVYLYRADNNQWYVNPVLGKRRGWLYNPSGSVSVPKTGWRLPDGKGGWLDDPQLTVRCGPLTECGDITVTSNGPAANNQSSCLGVYKRTDIISCGRPVFKQTRAWILNPWARDKYLGIAPGSTIWAISDKPGATAAGIQSAAGANCPASQRNRYSKRDNEKSWMYSDNGRWHEDPSITVTCSNHSPDYY